MNEQEFVIWLRQVTGQETGDLSALGYPVEFKYWQEVYKGIFPHYYGFMPSAIREAFPNESHEQLHYRLRIHRSMTKSELWKSIFDVKRILMGDKFTIQTGADLTEFLSVRKFGSDKKMLSFEDYMWNIIYPRRVLDPNAVLAVVPLPPENQSETVDVDLRVFSHFDIKYFSNELVIVFDRELSGNTELTYWVFTTTDVLIYERKDSRWTVRTWYTHNNGKTGVEFLGGLHMVISDYETMEYVCYFESDFSFAVPVMDKLERKDNQLESSTLNTVFPLRVTQGLECETCKGTGEVDKRDAITGKICYEDEYCPNPIPLRTKCDQCAGSGTIALGALDGIVATPPNNDAFASDEGASGKIGDKFIQYVSPDVSSIVELRTQEEGTMLQLSETLSITKPSKFAESGIAKEKDREGKFVKLKDISDSMSALIGSTLETIVLYRNINDSQREMEMQELKVIAPEDFQIKSVAEIQEEYYKDLEKKPLSIRIKQHKELLGKRFKENDDIHFLDDLAIMYTGGLYLYPLEQLQTMFNMGVISDDDVIKATRSFAVINMLWKMRQIQMDESLASITGKIDEGMTPFLNVTPVFSEPIPTPPIEIEEETEL